MSAASPRLARPDTVVRRRFLTGYLFVIVAFHLLLPLACLPYCFSWTGVALVFLGNCVFGSLGINLGYHRLLTHRSLAVPRWLERVFVLFGVCSLQDSPLRWVTIHRIHHQHSDEQADPHSPLVSFFWGHVEWLFVDNTALGKLETYERYSRDLLEDRFLRWLHRGGRWLWVWAAHVGLIALAGYAAGWLLTGTVEGMTQFGVSVFVWGVIARTVYVWHITWLVNSASHCWGYANYHTGDRSRNNWAVALLTNGEGWHNNHHAAPRAAAHGFHRWWEVDLTYAFIWGLEKVGLATRVVPVQVPAYKKVVTPPPPPSEAA